MVSVLHPAPAWLSLMTQDIDVGEAYKSSRSSELFEAVLSGASHFLFTCSPDQLSSNSDKMEGVVWRIMGSHVGGANLALLWTGRLRSEVSLGHK